jgi:hypothetical protein
MAFPRFGERNFSGAKPREMEIPNGRLGTFIALFFRGIGGTTILYPIDRSFPRISPESPNQVPLPGDSYGNHFA